MALVVFQLLYGRIKPIKYERLYLLKRVEYHNSTKFGRI